MLHFSNVPFLGAAPDLGAGHHWAGGPRAEPSRGGASRSSELSLSIRRRFHAFAHIKQPLKCPEMKGKKNPASFFSPLPVGGGGGCEPLSDCGQSDQLPSLHHQGDEQERRRRHRSGQEEGWGRLFP